MGSSNAKAARKRRSSSVRTTKETVADRVAERNREPHADYDQYPNRAGELFPDGRGARRSGSAEAKARSSSDGFMGRYHNTVPSQVPSNTPPQDSADFIFGGRNEPRNPGSPHSMHPGNLTNFVTSPSNKNSRVGGTEDTPPANGSGPEAVLWKAMQHRKNLCKDLWDRFQMEVQVQEALWFSEREARGQVEAPHEEVQARSLILAAVNTGDASQLQKAIAEAKQLLGGAISETLEECLLELCQTEEAYVALLSVIRALREGDRVELETWVEAVQVLGLSQADLDAAQKALASLKKQESAALEKLQAEQRIYEKLVFAMETQDIGTLRDVIAEADSAGVDAAPARAALEELLGERRRSSPFGSSQPRQRERSPERTGQESGPEAGAGGPSSSGSRYQGPNAHSSGSSGPSSSGSAFYAGDGGTGGSFGGPDSGGGPGGSADSGAGGRRPSHDANWQEEYDARRREWDRRRAEWERERRDWEARREERRRDWERQRQEWDDREQRKSEQNRRSAEAGGFAGSHPSAGSSAGFGAGASRPGFGAGPPGGEAPRNRSASSTAIGGRSEALQLLGFQPFSRPDQAELRAAYRKACLRWHPDRRHNHANPEEATHQFQRVKAAFDLLADK